MIKILCQAPGETDGCNWYRGSGPLGELSKAGKVQVTYVTNESEFNWGMLKAHHIFFVLRPTASFQLKAMEIARKIGTKLWIDFDDETEVPVDNPNYQYFQSSTVQSNLRMAAKMADLITVSTNFLKKGLTETNKNVVVLPNAIDPTVLKHRPTKPQQDLIMWRGTATHQRDVLEYTEQILEVAENNPEVKWAFVGWNPWFVTEKIKDALIIPPVKLLDYHEMLCTLRPQITIVPLHDSPFNRSKSNIAALEGSLAGSAILAPEWEEWSFDGISTYRGKTDFRDNLEALIHSDKKANDAQRAWSVIEKSYLLSVVNQERFRVIQALVES